MEVFALMDKIRIKNVRSLKDTDYVPLTPLTLLVGENSSGKSTFLRMFPLIKQSILKKTDGPILWAGDVDDYVDFGSFKETVTKESEGKIELGFQFRLLLDSGFSPSTLKNVSSMDRKASNVCFSITIESTNEKPTERETVSTVNIKINDSNYEYTYDKNKLVSVSVDGEKTNVEENEQFDWDDSEYNVSLNYMVWHYHFKGRTSSVFEYSVPNLNLLALKLILATDLKFSFQEPEYDEIFSSIGNELTKGHSLNDSVINASRKEWRKPEGMNTFTEKLLYYISQASEEQRKKLICAFKLFFLGANYMRLEGYIEQYFRMVHYIAPLRATAERYYRLRNSAIDEVDYQGKNLAIFLNSLEGNRMRRFQNWTMDSFGFKAVVKRLEGHLSVGISRGEETDASNLSDTGFGYSQLLPIITQLWELTTRKSAYRGGEEQMIPLVVAIEQPELHLHPAMQGRLAKAFLACIKLAKKNGYQLQLLLETHSKTIVDYFGRAVARGDIPSSDVAVVLFERDERTGYSNVTKTEYDQCGTLNKWPIGFFEPEE